MICPNCRAEYRDGFTRCSDCDVDLVWSIADETTPETQLVKVFESGNAALIPLVQSLLSDADIEFMMKGEPIQDLFGWGRLGTNLNFVIGPVQFFVREDDVAEASQIIETLSAETPMAEEDEPSL